MQNYPFPQRKPEINLDVIDQSEQTYSNIQKAAQLIKEDAKEEAKQIIEDLHRRAYVSFSSINQDPNQGMP